MGVNGSMWACIWVCGKCFLAVQRYVNESIKRAALTCHWLWKFCTVKPKLHMVGCFHGTKGFLMNPAQHLDSVSHLDVVSQFLRLVKLSAQPKRCVKLQCPKLSRKSLIPRLNTTITWPTSMWESQHHQCIDDSPVHNYCNIGCESCTHVELCNGYSACS